MSKTLYTMEGCGYCEDAVKKLKNEIARGEITVCHCDYDASTGSEALENCTKARMVAGTPDGVGYPTLVDEAGCVVDIDTGKRSCNK